MKKLIAIAIASVGLVACGVDTDPAMQEKWDSLSDKDKMELCLSYSFFHGNNQRFVEFVTSNEEDIMPDMAMDLAVVLGVECW